MGKMVMMSSSWWTVECSRNIPTLSFFASAFGVSTVNLTRDVDASNTPARVAATSVSDGRHNELARPRQDTHNCKTSAAVRERRSPTQHLVLFLCV